MNDIISRQAAIDTLNEYFERIGKLKRKGLTKGEKAISLDTVGAIKTLQSAQPVRHGKWIDEGQHADFFPHHEWRCSECGEQVLEIGEPWYAYCPNCGADMREEE